VRRARFQPAVIVALPLGLATLAISPNGIAGWGAVWSLFVFCGGTALMVQIARDLGKGKEPWLYKRWGGKPTTRLLRHRNTSNKVILSRRHQKLQTLLPGIQIPTAAEEEADPNGADEIYDACTAHLLERTRKKDAFPLVFDENCNYGFRRNLWGMKSLGIVTSLVGTLAIIAVLVIGFRSGVTLQPVAFACAAIDGLLLLCWCFWFTPQWVRTAAYAYAERLLASCETLTVKR